MKVFLKTDVPSVGLAGEIIKVSDGYAMNFLLPQNLAVVVNEQNEGFYKTREKHVEHRKEVINSKTSMLAEKINAIKITLARKMHDDGKLYGSVNSLEIVEALAEKGISVSKSQIEFEKTIKEKGSYDVIIKLSSKLKSTVKVTIVSE